MKKPLMILFDYGHTLLYEPEPDYFRGTRALFKHIKSNKYNLTPKQVCDFSQELYKKLDTARKDDFEPGQRQYQRFLYEYLGIELSVSLPAAEMIFWDSASASELMPGVDAMLDYINEQGIRSGVVSNIGWSGSAVAERVNRLLPLNKFEFIIASSEYMFRKPSPMLFELALRKAGLDAADVWFCGDKVKTDVEGAAEVGIFPVLYLNDNKLPGKQKAMPREYEHLRIHGWHDLISALDELG